MHFPPMSGECSDVSNQHQNYNIKFMLMKTGHTTKSAADASTVPKVRPKKKGFWAISANKITVVKHRSQALPP